MATYLKEPFINFLKYLIHVHHLYAIYTDSIINFENRIEAQINANRVLQKVEPDKTYKSEEEIRAASGDRVEAVQKEVGEELYTVKSSELVLIYSTLESAVLETVLRYFRRCKGTDLPDVRAPKYNLKRLIQLSHQEQRDLMADLYIQKQTVGVKYGFNRFEAVIEPLFGASRADSGIRRDLFRFAQTRNLIVHKNGVVDRRFKEAFDNQQQTIGERVSISSEMLNTCFSCAVNYADDILDRIASKRIGENKHDPS